MKNHKKLPMIYGHGDDLFSYGDKIKLNFSSNIYPEADLSALKKHLSARLDMIGTYPEPQPRRLETAIAVQSGTTPDSVIVTNGATEAIYLIARLLKESSTEEPLTHIIQQPTFSEYADACLLNHAAVLYDDKDVKGKKAYWLCNPNNPTGSVTPAADILNRADRQPQDIFIIDQSYEDYTLQPPVADVEATQRPNIVLLHSMTKRFCVPGLRIGYAVANPELINGLRRFQPPWSIGVPAEEAGLFLVESGFKAISSLTGYLKEARRLGRELSLIDGISVLRSETNFMLCRTGHGSAAALKDFLVSHHGILIRDASNFARLDSRYFRVAARTYNDDNMLINALNEYSQFVKQ